jgi:hypothetical protein
MDDHRKISTLTTIFKYTLPLGFIDDGVVERHDNSAYMSATFVEGDRLTFTLRMTGKQREVLQQWGTGSKTVAEEVETVNSTPKELNLRSAAV